MTNDAKQRPKVLCVDDDVHAVEGLKQNLRKIVRVTTATSGAEALELAREQGPFAVIISDMRMPHMNGAQLLANRRKSWPDTVRVLLTGHAEIDTAIAAIHEG
jgi:DNA-binding NtrC family response regulator